MNKDTAAGAAKKVSGSIQQAGGVVREKVDSALGDKKGAALGAKDQAAGAAKKVEGSVQETWGKVKDAVNK